MDISEQGWDLRIRVKARLKGMKLLPDVQVGGFTLPLCISVMHHIAPDPT